MASVAQPKNAIERRLDDLSEMWNEFAENPDARLLRWVADGDTARMIDLFLEMQNEEVSEIPDLFIRFNEPFEQAERYGFVLRDSLIAKYEEIREAIAEDDIPSDWSAPAVQDGETDRSALVRTCVSFREHYDDLMVNLALALLPQQVSDAAAWQQWLQTVIGGEVPETIRLMTVDDAGAPALDALCEQEPDRVVTARPALNMPLAYTELLGAVRGAGPGFTFRRYFLALSNAAAVGNIAAAQRAAQSASALAVEQNWPQMLTAVNMALGAAYLASGMSQETLQAYRSAHQAVAGADSEDPAAPQLAIQTKFAEASVLVGDQQYESAAAVYEEIGPLAEQQEDRFAQLESWRMASYCREVAGQLEPAWELGHKALDCGAEMDEETRASSTLAYAGQGLLRIAEHDPYREQRENVEQRMAELVGPDWEAQLAEGSAAS